MEIEFENLSEADLIVDCIYKGGKTPNISAEPFHKLIPGCENSGGFRKKLREDGSGKYAYIVLYTSEYSNAIVHAFQGFRAPFSGKIVHIFPEQSAAFN